MLTVLRMLILFKSLSKYFSLGYMGANTKNDFNSLFSKLPQTCKSNISLAYEIRKTSGDLFPLQRIMKSNRQENEIIKEQKYSATSANNLVIDIFAIAWGDRNLYLDGFFLLDGNLLYMALT